MFQENLEAFAAIQHILCTRPFFIKVGPTNELSMNNVLMWTLKGVEIIDEAPQPAPESTVAAMDTDHDDSAITEQEARLHKELMLEETAHGKKPLMIDLKSVTPASQNPADTKHAKLAEFTQLQEMKLASQEFDVDMYLLSDSDSEPLRLPQINTPPKEALPNWTKLSRKRSPPKSKESAVPATQTSNADADIQPRKKVRTLLFQEVNLKETTDDLASPANQLDKP